MKVLLSGHGRMGARIEELAMEAGHEVMGYADITNPHILSQMPKADVVIDFSHPAMLPHLTEYVHRTGTALCCGTTGFQSEDKSTLKSLGDYAPVLYSANYSLGIAVFRQILQQISPILKEDFNIEILETHHNKKVDAPSGTAKLLLDAIDPNHQSTIINGRNGECGERQEQEIGVFALRGGTVAGEHTVYYFGEDEVLSITHSATSRQIFAKGALKAATALVQKSKGFYTLDQILFTDTK